MQSYNKGVSEKDDPSLFGDRAYYVEQEKAEKYIKIMDNKEMDAELGNVRSMFHSLLESLAGSGQPQGALGPTPYGAMFILCFCGL